MGYRLTILSESAHGQVGDKRFDNIFNLPEGIKLLLWRGCGGGSIPIFLWEPRVLGFFQVGSGNIIPYYAGGVNLTKSMTTFFSHQDILQRGSNYFSRKG